MASEQKTNPASASGNAAYLQSMFGLEGKVAIVTGSTGGLGIALAEALFRAGANVVVNGRGEERSVKARNDIYAKVGKDSGILAVAGDVSVLADARRLVQETVAAFGKLDIIVNNAGINIPEAYFEDNDDGAWEKIQAVNLRGPAQFTKAALPYLRESPAGRVINLGSIGGHVGLEKNVLYTMTKGGVMLFTSSLAAELAQTKVTVNSVSPGVFKTPMNAKFAPGSAALADVVKMIPAKKLGNPEDLCGAVVYLASNCSSYVTGTDICVDGGYRAV